MQPYRGQSVPDPSGRSRHHQSRMESDTDCISRFTMHICIYTTSNLFKDGILKAEGVYDVRSCRGRWNVSGKLL